MMCFAQFCSTLLLLKNIITNLSYLNQFWFEHKNNRISRTKPEAKHSLLVIKICKSQHLCKHFCIIQKHTI